MSSDFTTPTPRATTRIKICGLTRAQDVDVAVAAGANAVGFVLYPKSSRYVSPEQTILLAQRLPPLVSPVLLFVNADAADIVQLARRVPGAILQFHGDETATQCADIAAASGCPYWRAAHIPLEDPAAFDLLEFAQRHARAQAILLDAKIAGYGGGGKTFDWGALPAHIPAHLILSGGLNAANVGEGMAALRGRGRSLAVDVSSGVEAPGDDGKPRGGIKDANKIRAFINAVRAADDQSN